MELDNEDHDILRSGPPFLGELLPESVLVCIGDPDRDLVCPGEPERLPPPNASVNRARKAGESICIPVSGPTTGDAALRTDFRGEASGGGGS